MNAEEIKKIRKALGMTQKQFAEAVDAALGTVADWEQSRRKPGRRSRNAIEKLKKELNIEM